MGLIDAFARLFRAGDEPKDPAGLRRLLFAAIARSDARRFYRLCERHRDAIFSHFAAWRTVPAELRAQPEAEHAYVKSLITIADTFAQRYGDKALLTMLMGPAESNPMQRWSAALRQAEAHMAAGKHGEATAILENILIDASAMSGTGVDQAMALAWSNLAVCSFRLGRLEIAHTQVDRAIALCRIAGDAEGERVCLRNCIEILKQLGLGAAVEARAQELARLEGA